MFLYKGEVGYDSMCRLKSEVGPVTSNKRVTKDLREICTNKTKERKNNSIKLK